MPVPTTRLVTPEFEHSARENECERREKPAQRADAGVVPFMQNTLDHEPVELRPVGAELREVEG